MIFILIFILFTVSCDVPKTYKVTGVVKDIEYTENKLLIDHEEIPGFMVKMVMYFNLHNSVDIKQFSINDSISFDLIIKNKNSYTLNYENLGKSLINADDDDFWNNDTESKYSLKDPGEYIENSTFLTLDNKEISLSDYEI